MKHILILLIFISLSANSLIAQTYEDMVSRSMDYVEQEDYPAAEQALKAALRKEPTNPNNAMLMVNLGTIQRNLGKYEEALLSYNVALEKYPDAVFIRHNRAALYCEMERMDEALKDYNSIIVTTPEDTEAIYRRGLIFLTMKNILAAEEDFEKVLEIDPYSLDGKAGLAMIKKRRGEWKEAEEAYSDLIAKNKSNADLYFNRAECYLHLNRLSRANEDIVKSIELGYIAAPVYIIRGQLRLAQYEKKLAKEDFLKAKELGADEDTINQFLALCR